MSKMILPFFYVLFISSVYIQSVNTALPSYIRPCSANAKLNECALRVAKAVSSTFAKGNEAMGIPKLEPLLVKEINTFGSSGSNGIKIVLRDNVMTGVGSLEVKKLNINLEKKIISIRMFGNLKLDSNYEMSGRLLIIPLTGKGKSITKLRNCKLEYSFEYNLIMGPDGKEYINITKDDIKYDIGRANFQLDNLFNGDQVLGETTNALLNELWKDVLEEVAPPVAQALKRGVTDSVKGFVKTVPYDEFILQ